jgi:hypothetical protein
VDLDVIIIYANMGNRLIEFDESAHRYTVDGAAVPNVTSILQPISAYRNFNAEKMETARQKGKAIHKTIELYTKGTLDLGELPDWLKPALYEWRRFVDVSQFEPIESELKVYNSLYRYAGTLDLYGSIAIKGLYGNFGGQLRDSKRIGVYIDVKRSLLGGATIGYQLAAYAEAHRMGMTKIPISPFKRFALVIREDNKFKLQEYTDPKDYLNFLTCLNWQRLKEKHNV